MRSAFDIGALMRLKETFGAEGELNERKFVEAFASVLGEGGEQLSADELVSVPSTCCHSFVVLLLYALFRPTFS
jgi:hypothetical protein